MLERIVEKSLYSSRWLLAPIYLGLSLALVALGIKFFAELGHTLVHIMELTESDVVLALLALVDLTLVASLIVMVMFSGYENFVSKIDMEGTEDKLGWLGKLDAGSLKLKVAASIVAISSIHLLRKFMQVDQLYADGESTASSKLLWYVIIHLTFVVSAVMLGVLDRMTAKSHD